MDGQQKPVQLKMSPLSSWFKARAGTAGYSADVEIERLVDTLITMCCILFCINKIYECMH